jgi:hypothetical protein
MELLAILSTIILVGTIATLILAVAAYVLYKIRERKRGASGAARPAAVMHPHLLTAPVGQALPHALPAARPFELADLRAPAEARREARPSEAATYVPPQHLRMPEPEPEPEFAAAPARSTFVEYAPAARSGRQTARAVNIPVSGDGLAWT